MSMHPLLVLGMLCLVVVVHADADADADANDLTIDESIPDANVGTYDPATGWHSSPHIQKRKLKAFTPQDLVVPIPPITPEALQADVDVLMQRAIIIPVTTGEHRATLIWMHGLGDKAASFRDLFLQMHLLHTRIVLLNAPIRRVSINSDMRQQAWYDVKGLSLHALDRDSRLEDVRGIQTTVRLVTHLLDQEAQLVPASRIVLGGFSQGAVISVLTALRYSHPLAGVISASGYLAHAFNVAETMTKAGKQTPILAFHCEGDTLIPFSYAHASYQRLQALGVAVDFQHHAGRDHTLLSQHVRTMASWLVETLDHTRRNPSPAGHDSAREAHEAAERARADRDMVRNRKEKKEKRRKARESRREKKKKKKKEEL